MTASMHQQVLANRISWATGNEPGLELSGVGG